MLIPFVSSTTLDQIADNKGLLMLVVTCTGLIVVFLVLIILIMVFNVFGLFGSGKEKKSLPAGGSKKALDSSPAQKAVAPAAFAGALPASSSGISEEVIAAISAAVAVTLDGKPFAIRHVRRAPAGRNAWSAAGILENTRPF